MESKLKTARIAGLLYLTVVLTGIFHLMYVPSRLIDWKHPSETVSNIVAHETLFRFGVVAGIVCYIAFLLLPLALYKLLSDVHKTYAVLMVTLAVVSVPITLVNMLNKFDVLTLISQADYLQSLTPEQVQTQVLQCLDEYRNGNQLASVFWGLWLFPFGYLVFKSGFLPKVLGVLLMAGCVGYIINFLCGFIYPPFDDSIIASLLTIPGSLGEIGITLWLLIKGVKNVRSLSNTVLTSS